MNYSSSLMLCQLIDIMLDDIKNSFTWNVIRTDDDVASFFYEQYNENGKLYAISNYIVYHIKL